MGTKISALPAASALSGSEVYAAVQGGSNVKASADQQKTYANTIDAPAVVGTTTTLDATYYGKLTYVSASGVTITFPTAPATTQLLRVYNGSAGNITVNGGTIGAGKEVQWISVSSAWKRLEPQIG